MQSQKKNLTISTPKFGGLYQALSSQSIIDVFVVQGQILPADGEKIKSKYQNNLAIERFLLANKLISREAINKAYSIILKLPFISLGSVAIPDEVKKIIPEKIAKKFQIVAFAEKRQVVNLAVGNPGELFLPQNQALENIASNKGLTFELFVTTPQDIQKIYNRGKQSQDDVLLDKGSLPVIFLRNRNIEPKLLHLLPLEFISKNRLSIFDKISDRNFRIAEENPFSSKTRKIIEYLKTNNKLELEEFSTSKDDIDYLISLYQKTSDPDIESQPTTGQEEQSGAFNNFIGSLVSDNESGITSKETVQKATPIKGTTFEEASGQKPEVSRQDEIRHEIEANRRIEEEEKDIGKLLGKDVKTIEELKEIAKGSSIPKLVAAMISYALGIGSSDIHIEPEVKRIRIRCRIDGILKDILQLPREYDTQITSRVKILGQMKLDETRIPQDGRFSVRFRDREVDVRVSMLPTVYGEKTVMRILDKSAGIRSLEDLGFTGSAFKIIMEQIKRPYGVIMATGPTGSGKSTTLYAILNRLNQPGVNVVTLEDPVEYEIAGINQCQIKPKIGFTFAEGLRSILRQDPNIIMVGEVRDADTAGMATHAALTGHLVLTTLHTNDAASALPRLINMGIEPFLITSSINLIIAQRLLRRVCPKCREKTDIPAVLMKALHQEIESIPKTNKEDLARVKDFQFYKGRGCKECSEGYKGRIGVYELLVMSDKIESLAVARRPASEIKTVAVEAGMLTMKQDGILKAIDGLTTVDEVLLATGEIGIGEATILAKDDLKEDFGDGKFLQPSDAAEPKTINADEETIQ